MDIYHRMVIVDYDKTPLRDQNVVVFVHGSYGYPSDMTPLTNNLTSLTNVNLRLVNLGPTADTLIQQDVLSLEKELEPYINCNIILVGLSKGGVTVATYFLLMNDKRIKKAITISSPVMGTDVALAFPTESNTYKGLGSGNSLAMLVNEQATNKAIYHVVPTYDHLIIPTTNAYYPNTNPNNIYHYTSARVGHSGICYDLNVANQIAEWINNI